jgi:hypothetical protein
MMLFAIDIFGIVLDSGNTCRLEYGALDYFKILIWRSTIVALHMFKHQLTDKLSSVLYLQFNFLRFVGCLLVVWLLGIINFQL